MLFVKKRQRNQPPAVCNLRKKMKRENIRKARERKGNNVEVEIWRKKSQPYERKKGKSQRAGYCSKRVVDIPASERKEENAGG
jgi:hypothetical protein